jgi:hypothetical protein
MFFMLQLAIILITHVTNFLWLQDLGFLKVDWWKMKKIAINHECILNTVRVCRQILLRGGIVRPISTYCVDMKIMLDDASGLLHQPNIGALVYLAIFRDIVWPYLIPSTNTHTLQIMKIDATTSAWLCCLACLYKHLSDVSVHCKLIFIWPNIFCWKIFSFLVCYF